MVRASATNATNVDSLSVQGLLLDIDHFASHDGPGIRTTVFLKGCPLSCIWCHSPESRCNKIELIYQADRCTDCWLCIDECPVNALSQPPADQKQVVQLDRNACEVHGQCVEVCYPGALQLAGRTVTVEELLTQVKKNIPYFERSGGGVTLSGGEPTAQPKFSYAFLKACQDVGIHTALETTGFARWNVLEKIATVTDLFLYDIKLADSATHQQYTGVPNELIVENLRRLSERGSTIHVRVPCIAGINDSPEQIAATAELVAGMGLKQIVLLPYNSAANAKYEWLGADYALGHRNSQSEETMNELAEICQQHGLTVNIGG